MTSVWHNISSSAVRHERALQHCRHHLPYSVGDQGGRRNEPRHHQALAGAVAQIPVRIERDAQAAARYPFDQTNALDKRIRHTGRIDYSHRGVLLDAGSQNSHPRDLQDVEIGTLGQNETHDLELFQGRKYLGLSQCRPIGGSGPVCKSFVFVGVRSCVHLAKRHRFRPQILGANRFPTKFLGKPISLDHSPAHRAAYGQSKPLPVSPALRTRPSARQKTGSQVNKTLPPLSSCACSRRSPAILSKFSNHPKLEMKKEKTNVNSSSSPV